MRLLFLYPAVASLVFAGLIEATCYNPDRTTATSAVPCTSNSTTFCCGTDAICLSSGYCLSATSQPFTLYRGSCTDSGWGTFCAYYCVNYQTGSNAPIVSVGLNSDSRAMYCCGYQSANSNSTRCANGDAPFVLEDGAMIFGRAALSNASTGSTTETTNTTCASDGNAESSSSHSSGNNNSTAIGVGVGVPLGILALCAVAWALVERRRGKQRQSIMSGGAQMTAPGFMSQRRQKGPTELYSPKHTSSDSATHEPAVAEMMGPEARH